MKHFSIILIIALIIISCKLFDDEDGDNNDKKIPIPYDYELGETFELKADSSVVIKDSTNNKYYTLWFSGPVEDNRFGQSCQLVTIDKVAKLNMQLINGHQDTAKFELEVLECVEGFGKEKVIYFGDDSLVFSTSNLEPQKMYDSLEIQFGNYKLDIASSKNKSIPQISGNYTGTVTYFSSVSPIEITITDSTFQANPELHDSYYEICHGAIYQTVEQILFERHCVIFFDHDPNILLFGFNNYRVFGDSLEFKRYFGVSDSIVYRLKTVNTWN